MARPEKYATHVQPHLEKISAWRKQGMKLDAIAKELEIAPSRLYEYQNKYQELQECLTIAQKELYADMVIVAEKSLYQKLDDRFEVVEIRRGITYDKNGTPHEYEDVIERRIPADTTALIFALKNRNPEYWKDRTELGIDIDVIPEPLAPVRKQDIIELKAIESTTDEVD
jgi:hypothetical protein